MTQEIAKPMSPMEEFQDNLKKSLRDDIARMLPDAAIAEMIQRVVNEEFFTRRRVQKYPGDHYRRDETVELPSAFQEMVMKAAEPILQREAAKLVAKLEYKIADAIKETVEAGASDAIFRAFTSIVNGAFAESEMRFRQSIVELLKRNGLQVNAY